MLAKLRKATRSQFLIRVPIIFSSQSRFAKVAMKKENIKWLDLQVNCKSQITLVVQCIKVSRKNACSIFYNSIEIGESSKHLPERIRFCNSTVRVDVADKMIRKYSVKS